MLTHVLDEPALSFAYPPSKGSVGSSVRALMYAVHTLLRRETAKCTSMTGSTSDLSQVMYLVTAKR